MRTSSEALDVATPEPWKMQSPRAGLEEEAGSPGGASLWGSTATDMCVTVASETSPLSHRAGNPKWRPWSQNSGCQGSSLLITSKTVTAKGPLRSDLSRQAEPRWEDALGQGGPALRWCCRHSPGKGLEVGPEAEALLCHVSCGSQDGDVLGAWGRPGT